MNIDAKIITQYYGCKSTGMVCGGDCKSGCHACKNAVAFPSLAQALQAGFRPCIRCQPEKQGYSGAKEELILSAKAFLEENYQEKFSLAVLSSHLHINEDYLGRVFKQIVGETPLRYHNYVRCQQARILLEESAYSVEIISCQVGYLSESHFIKVFKSIYGQSPLQYRKGA